MEYSGGPLHKKPGVAGKPSGWGWLAAAAVAGALIARGHRRSGALLGLGLVWWRCQNAAVSHDGFEERATRGMDEKKEGVLPRKVENLRMGEMNVEDRARESPPGGWMLKLEPVPLVVRDEARGAAGQGSELLGQGPGVAIEVPEWMPPFGQEGGWASAGGEIPDQVELPELEEPAGPGLPS